jgi:transketolase
MSIEAMGTHGWEKYAHAPFGLQTFGASAPAKDLFTHFGFTVPNLLTRAKEVIDFYKDVPGGAPSLIKRPTFPVIQPPHP